MSLYSNKKGFVFFIDMIMAAMIITAGAAFLLFQVSSSISPQQARFLTDDLAREAYSKQIIELDYPEVLEMILDEDIVATTNTLLQQIVEFYSLYEDTSDVDYLHLAGNLSEATFPRVIPQQYSFQIRLTNPADVTQTIYSRERKALSNADASSVSRAIVIGIDRNDEFYGPYLFEMVIWI